MPSLNSKQSNPLTEPKGHNMSTTHYLAHTRGMSRTDLYIDVEATDSTGSDFTYRLKGEMETAPGSTTATDLNSRCMA